MHQHLPGDGAFRGGGKSLPVYRACQRYWRAMSCFWNLDAACRLYARRDKEEDSMNGLIYLVGLVVVILAVLSFFGLR